MEEPTMPSAKTNIIIIILASTVQALKVHNVTNNVLYFEMETGTTEEYKHFDEVTKYLKIYNLITDETANQTLSLFKEKMIQLQQLNTKMRIQTLKFVMTLTFYLLIALTSIYCLSGFYDRYGGWIGLLLFLWIVEILFIFISLIVIHQLK